MNRFCFSVLMSLGLLGGLVAIARAQTLADTSSTPEFRIDTDVYLDQSKPPIASTKTLFLKDRIIDWDDANRRRMSIDLVSEQIELADFSLQRRCQIEMQQLASKLSALKTQLTPEQVTAWSSPTAPIADGDGYERIQSGNLRYRFKTTSPRNPQMASAYSEFANWSVQVSAVYPPFKPPLLRMQLNDYLAEQNRLPSEIQLVDLRSKASEPLVAKILVQEALTKQDRERLSDWDMLVGTLKLVPDAEYFQSQRLASERPSSAK